MGGTIQCTAFEEFWMRSKTGLLNSGSTWRKNEEDYIIFSKCYACTNAHWNGALGLSLFTRYQPEPRIILMLKRKFLLPVPFPEPCHQPDL